MFSLKNLARIGLTQILSWSDYMESDICDSKFFLCEMCEHFAI